MTSVLAADFGPLLLNVDVDDMVLAQLQLWLPTYLYAIERERELDPTDIGKPSGGPFFDRPQTYASVLDDDEFLDGTIPGVFVTSADTDTVEAYADGNNSASWNLSCSVVVRGRKKGEARRIASYFEGCIRRIMLQQKLEGGRVDWIGSSVGPLEDPTNAGRYLAVGVSQYVFHADYVVSADGGPVGAPYIDPDPANDPAAEYQGLALVAEVTAEVDGVTTIEGG